jgi:hypothetical protein
MRARAALAIASLAIACDPSGKPSTPAPASPPASPPAAVDAGAGAPDVAPPAAPSWSPDASSPRWSISGPDLTLGGPGGARLGALAPTVRLDHAPADAGAPRARRATLSPERVALGPAAVSQEPAGWRARATARAARADLEYVLSGEPGSPILHASLTIAYREDTSVGAELADLSWRVDSARAPDHGLRRVDVGADGLHVPSHTPRELDVASGDARLALLAPRVPALMARVEGGALTATLELDHRDHHPFMIYDGCPATKTSGPSRWLDRTPRRAGESVTHRWTILLGEVARPTPRRYPAGAPAAIALTDHADQGRADRTEAFAFGMSGALDADTPRSRGFAGRGLRYTKTVFSHQKTRWPAQLSDPAFARVARALEDAGSEVGLHSMSGDTDSRDEVARDFAAFTSRFAGRTWIDHGPHHNCEALASTGWDPSSPHYTLDLMAAAGFDTVWAVKDLAVRGGRLDMLATGDPGERRAVLYTHERLRHAGAPAPVVFASAWFFHDRARLLRRFSEGNLDRLRDDHGLLLAHTYLDTYRATGKFAPRALLASNGRLRPDVDAMFARLAARQTSGDLVTMGVGPLAHHVRDAARVTILPTPEGDWEVTAPPGGRGLTGLTLRADRRGVQLDTPGAAGRRGPDLWLDLEPGQAARVRAGVAAPVHLDLEP